KPPARAQACTSAPRRCNTRATLMPPPPAKRCASVQRSLCVGCSRSVVVLRSSAGLRVRVTNAGMAAKPTIARVPGARLPGPACKAGPELVQVGEAPFVRVLARHDLLGAVRRRQVHDL